MERFCYELEDAETQCKLLSQLSGSGAFRRFKNLIHNYNIAEDRYRYWQKALEEIAIAWLEKHDITRRVIPLND